MTIFTRKIPHRKKPSGKLRLNRSNSLSKYLVGGWYANEQGGDVLRDISGNNDGSKVGTTVGFEPAKYGNAIVSTGNGSADRFDLGSIVSGNPLSLFGATNALNATIFR